MSDAKREDRITALTYIGAGVLGVVCGAIFLGDYVLSVVMATLIPLGIARLLGGQSGTVLRLLTSIILSLYGLWTISIGNIIIGLLFVFVATFPIYLEVFRYIDIKAKTRLLGVVAISATIAGILFLYVAVTGGVDKVWFGVRKNVWLSVFWLSFAFVHWYKLFRRRDLTSGAG